MSYTILPEESLFGSSCRRFDDNTFNFLFGVLRQSEEFKRQLTKLGIRNNDFEKCIVDLLNGFASKELREHVEILSHLEEMARRIIRRYINDNVNRFIL